MDIETSQAIETLRGDIRNVERTVKGVASQVVEIRAQLVTFDAKLDELRVHAQVLNEAVRDDIQMVAEAVAALTAKGSTR